MSDIILHHFDSSPFAEKVRLALGLKALAWSSVEIPMVLPKPALTSLTGGYRKTPVLQIGADIYCDTQRIAMELEARFPTPTLFPNHSRALSMALSQWSDVALFQPGAGLSMGTNTALPEELLRDRREFFNFMDFSTLAQQLPHLFSQFCGQVRLIEELLEDGRQYLAGESPGWMDILAYFPIWMCRGNIANSADILADLPLLAAWEERVRAIGHGQSSVLSAESALAIAGERRSTAKAEITSGVWPALALGASVTVTSQDYGSVPVRGELLRLTHADIAIRRHETNVGELVVHFPRLGYRLEEG